MATVIFDGIAYGMLLFLMSVGLSITLGLMSFVNLAHGVFAMIGGYAALVAMNSWGLGFVMALVCAFVAAAVVGGLLEVLLFRHLYGDHPLAQVLLSIGVVFVATAVASWLFGPSIQMFTLPAWLQGQYQFMGIGLGRYRSLLVFSGLAVMVLLLLGLSRTSYGARVRAAVDNARAANGMGINVQRLFFLTFALGCGLAGLGGALSLELLGMEPAFALKYMIYFLMVVAVGGAGTLVGPFVAALLIGVIDMTGKYYFPEMGAFLVYIFMVLVLLLRPNGLISRKGQA
ncbi:MAG: branched-chain amino acid ABC transporter permease [Burkholderiaceae bacterium]|nr:branched-chain amino acid ABC transporter permease [Burkholderiaceae bacterium]